MKKSLVLVLLTILTLYLHAQKASIGLIGGGSYVGNNRVNTTDYNYDAPSNPATNPPSYYYTGKTTSQFSSLFSYFGGFVFNVPMGKTFTFRPQVEYILKGYNNHQIEYDVNNAVKYDDTYKLTANVIEVPLNFVFTAPAKSGRLYIGAGPYASYVISGKRVNSKTNTTTSVPDKVVFNVNDTSQNVIAVNQIDYGFNILAGYQWNGGFFINVNYAHGLRDFRTLKEEGDQFPLNKNTEISIGIGYMFSKKR